ncbi:MAG TPA: hypothetical protein VET30_02505 [Pseudoxanthomonas sp.]|nr:hypothetical protein [Pseudoxanthomonas sp.]
MNGISLNGPVKRIFACVPIAFALASGVHTREGDTLQRVDLSWEAQSRSACESDNFESFFEAFVRSPQVRKERTAKSVEHRSLVDPSELLGQIAGIHYQEIFAISLGDYYYVDTVSKHKWESGTLNSYEDLWVDVEPTQDRSYEVQYSKAILRDDGEGDGKTFVRRYGTKKGYVFEMRQGCWELTQDLR